MGVGEWRLDDHVEQVEQVDGERVRGRGECSKIPKNRSDHFFWKMASSVVLMRYGDRPCMDIG